MYKRQIIFPVPSNEVSIVDYLSKFRFCAVRPSRPRTEPVIPHHGAGHPSSRSQLIPGGSDHLHQSPPVDPDRNQSSLIPEQAIPGRPRRPPAHRARSSRSTPPRGYVEVPSCQYFGMPSRDFLDKNQLPEKRIHPLHGPFPPENPDAGRAFRQRALSSLGESRGEERGSFSLREHQSCKDTQLYNNALI